ncbi:MAG: hypothetical protein R3343_01330 [Nitriliruptorales bacterium]|nr:hypothetical protein [Nitriliruptorales bacterium]
MKTLTKPTNVRLIAAVASLVLVSALIVRTTQAAFSATTDNPGNDFASGEVSLTDNFAVPMFDVTATTPSVEAGNLAPGDTKTNCIEVTYTGTIDPSVPIAITTANTGGSIAGDLNVTVVMGDKGVTCAGTTLSGGGATVTAGTETVAAFGSVSTWTPNPEGANDDLTRAFQFTVEFDSASTTQNGSADADFVWTAKS